MALEADRAIQRGHTMIEDFGIVVSRKMWRVLVCQRGCIESEWIGLRVNQLMLPGLCGIGPLKVCVCNGVFACVMYVSVRDKSCIDYYSLIMC